MSTPTVTKHLIDVLRDPPHAYRTRIGDAVETFIGRLHHYQAQTPPRTSVSGPSATVDIEMVRVAGAYEPHQLEVVTVS